MNDIENSLRRTSAQPRRELRADFTAQIVSKLHGRPSNTAWFGHIKETLFMKLPHKPLSIALAIFGTIAITGTATAATLGWQPFTVLFGGQKTANAQSRVIEVNTQNCRMQNNAFSVLGKDKPKDNTYYYRIKATSHYTDAEVTQMVRGECDFESDSAQNTAALQAIVGKPVGSNTDQLGNDFNHSDLVGGMIDNTITAINGNRISFSMTNGVGNDSQVYTLKDVPVSQDVIILDKGMRLELNELKVGDHVAYSYHATGSAKSNSETTAPWQVNPAEISIAVITKNPSDVLDAMRFEHDSYGQVEQVMPCTTQPDGYCNIEQLESK